MSEVATHTASNERMLDRANNAYRRLRTILGNEGLRGHAVVGPADFQPIYNDLVTTLSALYGVSGGPGWKGFEQFDEAYRLLASYDRARADVFGDVRNRCREKMIDACNFKVFPEASGRATLRHLTMVAEERSKMLTEAMREVEEQKESPGASGRLSLSERIKGMLLRDREKSKVPAHKRIGLIRWLISFDLRVATILPVIEKEILRFKAANYPISKEDLWSLRAMSDELVTSQCPADAMLRVTADIEMIAETALNRAQDVKIAKDTKTTPPQMAASAAVGSQEKASLAGNIKLKLADAKTARKELATARGVAVGLVAGAAAPPAAVVRAKEVAAPSAPVVAIGAGAVSDLPEASVEIAEDSDFGAYSLAAFSGR